MRLSELHPRLSRAERENLAGRCGISLGYLWQLATRWKGKKPTVDLLAKIAECDPRLTVADLVEEFTALAAGGECSDRRGEGTECPRRVPLLLPEAADLAVDPKSAAVEEGAHV